MGVKNCMLPWHWMLVTNDGQVLPCGHGAGVVGDLKNNTVEEIWNGEKMQSIRRAILADKVHPICKSIECPYQAASAAFGDRVKPVEIPRKLAKVFDRFDEEYYLALYPEVKEAVERGKFTSGLEHFIRHGRGEGRPMRLLNNPDPNKSDKRKKNASLALLEYSRGAKKLKSMPVDIVIAVTTVCNLRCVMCPHGLGIVEKPRNMPLTVIDSISRALNYVSRIILSGVGEPTISPAFWKVLDHFSAPTPVFIRVNTNAQAMTAEKARKIVQSSLTEISISLDAASAETYSRIRGGDFRRALAGVEMLVQAAREHATRKIEISINLTMMLENLSEMTDFVRMGKELGVDRVVFSQLFSFGDQPSWKVKRGDYEFVYSENMPIRHPNEAKAALMSAQSVADQLNVPIRMIDNVESYLTT